MSLKRPVCFLLRPLTNNHGMHFLEVLEVLSMRYERTEERDDRVYIGCNCTYKVLRSSLAGLERSVRIETRCVIMHEHFTDAQSTCVSRTSRTRYRLLLHLRRAIAVL